MTQKIFIFYANPYSFEDQQTKQKREGVSVQYLVTNDLVDNGQNSDGSLGYAPCKDSIQLEKLQSLVKVPGFYDGEFIMAPAKGQTRLKLSSVNYLADYLGEAQ